ncbi:MAG: sodium-dependent transporter [Bacteroidia bacterium]
MAKERWGTRIGLILAMAGNAVGLGNFLRFPVQAIQNGGGAFIIPYLVSFLLMGIPLLWIEWTLGRYGGKHGYHSPPMMMYLLGRRKIWLLIGVFGIFTNLTVAAYYCYIESWALAYVFHSVGQTFSGMTLPQVENFFVHYVDAGESISGLSKEALWMYLLVLFINTYVLSRGLQSGIEAVSKWGMPLLLLLGLILAIRGWTLGDSGAPAGCTDCDARLGMAFLWTPQMSSLADPKVWLAAAGQIFFTLSLGMGTIQCYASYLREKDDIVLNAMSAGWLNEFVEIVLGASIVIPIAAGYLGIGWVQKNAGFGMGFQVMPYLFYQSGSLWGTLGSVFWFGLLFFAGITSSLAMGTPWIGLMRDHYYWSTQKSAWSFGGIVLLLGIPTVVFFNQGVFDEYDYWAGTVSLVVFALGEAILFSWVWGVETGWMELSQGAQLKIPRLYKPIIRYVTPGFLVVIFLSAFLKPQNNAWKEAFTQLARGGGWPLAGDSIPGKILHLGQSWTWIKNGALTPIFYQDMGRILLVVTFLVLFYLIYRAAKRAFA